MSPLTTNQKTSTAGTQPVMPLFTKEAIYLCRPQQISTYNCRHQSEIYTWL